MSLTRFVLLYAKKKGLTPISGYDLYNLQEPAIKDATDSMLDQFDQIRKDHGLRPSLWSGRDCNSWYVGTHSQTLEYRMALDTKITQCHKAIRAYVITQLGYAIPAPADLLNYFHSLLSNNFRGTKYGQRTGISRTKINGKFHYNIT